jgi:hypothetical protein
VSALPNNHALARGFLAGALTALRKRAAARGKSANQRIILHEIGAVIVTSGAAADLAWLCDLAAIGSEIETKALLRQAAAPSEVTSAVSGGRLHPRACRTRLSRLSRHPRQLNAVRLVPISRTSMRNCCLALSA